MGNPNGRPTHGLCKTRAYSSWQEMKKRCDNTQAKWYPAYGGRGITYQESWKDFAAFFADMGERPEGLSLGRINNSLGYTKENCRWETATQQARNKDMYRSCPWGITGVYQNKMKGYVYWEARGYTGRLYHGKDFFEACCARKSWEANHVRT